MSSNNFNRYSFETGTCNNRGEGFIEGFFNKFQDSYFYTFFIQFILVALIYFNVGKGIYWKVLFYAATAGLVGSFLENMTVAYICRREQDKNQNPGIVVFFLIDEIFWIINEYAIPYLNLIKMKVFARGKISIYVRYTIITLLIPFIIFRLLIGYNRMDMGYLQDSTIQAYHGFAFAVMALADIICTSYILYYVKKNNSHLSFKTSSINNYIEYSSYIILICVDIVSIVLSILDILTNISSFQNSKILKSICTPLHCLKCTFILILSIDAFLFKYEANISSIHGSSENNSKTYLGNSSSTNCNINKNFIDNSKGLNSKSNTNNNSCINKNNNEKNSSSVETINNNSNYYYNNIINNNNNSNNDITNNNNNYNNNNKYDNNNNNNNNNNNSSSNENFNDKLNQNEMMNVSPFNYTFLKRNDNFKSSDMLSTKAYTPNNRSIIKNYTNIKTQSLLFNSSNNKAKPLEVNVYPSQTFGFLSNQNK